MPFSYSAYKESDKIQQYRSQLEHLSDASVQQAKAQLDTHTANKPQEWNGGQYKSSMDTSLKNIENRKNFTYDLNADALYQQYKDQYVNQGKLAMQNTVGQAATLTGGYSNSYAVTAGNQAYQSYLQQLNDVVPQLYQMAYDRYNNETEDMYKKYSLYKDAYDTEYSEHRDLENDWRTDRDYLQNAYNTEYDIYSTERNYYTDLLNDERDYEYGLYKDAYDRALSEYQLALAEASAGGGGGGGGGRSHSNPVSSGNTIAQIAQQVVDKYGKGKALLNTQTLDQYLNTFGIGSAQTNAVKAALRDNYGWTNIRRM